MKKGHIILHALMQADRKEKIRPVLLLREILPFNDYLGCGISTKIHLKVDGFDELLDDTHLDFERSGLVSPSIIRLGYLGIVPQNQIAGNIGSLSDKTYQYLIKRLSDFILKGLS